MTEVSAGTERWSGRRWAFLAANDAVLWSCAAIAGPSALHHDWAVAGTCLLTIPVGVYTLRRICRPGGWGSDVKKSPTRAAQRRLVELIRQARSEGWYEDNPGWDEVDRILGLSQSGQSRWPSR